MRENIRVAADIHRGWSRTKVDPAAQVDEIIERVGLTEVADVRVDRLPTGQARLVELGRALAASPRCCCSTSRRRARTRPRPSASPSLLRELAAEGMAVVLVEHDMQLVIGVCDVIHVLDFGRIIAVGHAGRDPGRPSRARGLPRA